MPICADVGKALVQLAGCNAVARSEAWLKNLEKNKTDYPFVIPEGKGIKPQYAISLLNRKTRGEAIVALGVGQHQMWAMQHYRPEQTRSFLSSSGFGTMGYGLPAAIGAKTACPGRMVIDIDGDGSFNMTLHELSTCRRYQIGVKVMVINNQWLGMVRQWQDMIYNRHRACSDLSDPFTEVKKENTEGVYPDFVSIAGGYSVKAERVLEKEQLDPALDRLLADPDEPYVLDVIVDREANVYPMIPAGGTYKDIILSDADLEARNNKDSD